MNVSAESVSSSNLWYFGKGISVYTFYRYELFDNLTQPSDNVRTELVVHFVGHYYDNTHDVSSIAGSGWGNNSGFWLSKVYLVKGKTIQNATLEFYPGAVDNRAVFLKNSSSEAVDAFSKTIGPPNFPVAIYPGYRLDYPPGGEWTVLGSEISMYGLNGTETITVPAGTFTCTQMVGDSITWINGNLPFPVKSIHHSQNAPINHVRGYQLIEIGHGIPVVPEFPTSATAIIATVSLLGIVTIVVKLKKFFVVDLGPT